MKSNADSDDSEIAVKLKEAAPTVVDTCLFPPGMEFMRLAGGDNATFAFTMLYDLLHQLSDRSSALLLAGV